MCTSIVEIAGAEGAGRSMDGWFSLTHSVVAYDHPQHALLEEAVTIDFVNHAKDAGARAAVELTLDSAKALHAAMAKVIEAAEIEDLTGNRARMASGSCGSDFVACRLSG